MRKEIIETGKTVDAAIDAACVKLGCERENCEWEIIDLPKKTFLGLKTIPAKVKVSIEVPDKKPEPKREKKQPPRQEHKQEPPKQKREEPVKAEPAKEMPKAPAPKVEKPVVREDQEYEKVLVTEGFRDKETAAMQYIDSILKEFSLTAKLELFREGSGICVDITGEGLGTIIGRRGETLDAIQYLTGLVANRLEGDYLRVTVDCGDYRTKRKETLEALAKKLAAQVLKTNVSKTLEPMNPFERRVIHATVSTIEGVSSSSVGEEPNRRVVITSPTAKRPSYRSGGGSGYSRDGERSGRRPGGRDRDRDRDRDRRGGDRDRRPRSPRSQTTAPSGPPKETPESAAMGDTPIGKLDLE